MILTVHTKQETEELNDLYGLFFEDINHAADGGLYAELVQNRSFEFCSVDNTAYHGLTAWEKIETDGQAELTVKEGYPVSEKNPHYLEIAVTTPGWDVGVWNVGFNGGIPLKKGAQYYFSCYARSQDACATHVKVSLRSESGTLYQEKTIALSRQWTKIEETFTAPADDWKGRLAITVVGKGKVHLDFVSLFPADTYKGRKNGLRRDLAEALEAMHPKFLRFPGGCLVHDGSLNAEDRNSQYRWKNTIGPLEHRPARRNNWGYNQTLGLGFYEYFVFCEDLGAKPLPVLPGGYNPHSGQAADGASLEEFIQDALDLIEFANGSVETQWGSKRAEMGHPAPFHLEYLAIGNEEVGQAFFDRYPQFYRAIKAQYPEIKVIGTSGPFAGGPEYDRGWQSAREDGAELVDEHYYQSPEWFIANHRRYDGFPEGPKVFVGEYASKGNTWFNALAESSYMIGLERNAQTVGLACYAPLFCNADYVNWQPDMIWFDNHQIMRTPNYYVQKLFMEHQGDTLLAQELRDAGVPTKLYPFPDNLTSEIILTGHESAVEFSDITVTNLDTNERLELDAIFCDDTEYVLDQVTWENYSLKLKAKEVKGWKGFRIWFSCQDAQNKLLWQLGGWDNGSSLILEQIRGNDSVLAQKEMHVEKGRVYSLELRVRGRQIETFIDGSADLQTESRPVVAEPLYAVSGRDKTSGDVILKLVNVRSQPQTVTIELDDMSALDGTVYIMSGYGLEAQNSLGALEQVVPKEETVSFDAGMFDWTMPAESVCILRLREKNEKRRINDYE